MDSAADRLTADPYFADVPLAVEKGQKQPGLLSYEDQIAQGLNEAATVICLPLPVGDIELKDISLPYMELSWQPEVLYHSYFPNPDGNRKSLNDIAEHIIAVFWWWIPMDLGQVNIPMQPAYTIGDKDGKMVARMKMRTALPTTYDIPKVAPVKYSIQSQVVTLTCATANAAIWYTINGSFPGTNTLAYTAPFIVNPGDVIKARAYRPAYQTGDLLKFTVP